MAVALAACAAACTVGCVGRRPALVPMPVVSLPANGPAAPATGSPCLVVFLPGIRDLPSDFEQNGFVELARDRGVACDFQAADAHLGYFSEHQLVERLHADVIVPARAHGYEQVWLAGVSLGGLGSILYAQQHPQEIAGLVLIAPYLGSPGSVDDLRNSGTGTGDAGSAEDRRDALASAWGWLGGYGDRAARRPPLYLVYGTADRYARSHRALAELLPGENVIAGTGGHDWATWRRLWAAFLKTGRLPAREQH